MIRRLIGSVVMLTVPAERVLALASIRAFIMMLIATFSAGHVATWALISVGLFY